MGATNIYARRLSIAQYSGGGARAIAQLSEGAASGLNPCSKLFSLAINPSLRRISFVVRVAQPGVSHNALVIMSHVQSAGRVGNWTISTGRRLRLSFPAIPSVLAPATLERIRGTSSF